MGTTTTPEPDPLDRIAAVNAEARKLAKIELNSRYGKEPASPGRNNTTGVISGSYVAEYVDLDDRAARIFTTFASNSMRSAAKYGARTCADGYLYVGVRAL